MTIVLSAAGVGKKDAGESMHIHCGKARNQQETRKDRTHHRDLGGKEWKKAKKGKKRKESCMRAGKQRK